MSEPTVFTEIAELHYKLSLAYKRAALVMKTEPCPGPVPMPPTVAMPEPQKNTFKHLNYEVKWVHHNGRHYYDISRNGIRLGRLSVLARDDDQMRTTLEALERDNNKFNVCNRFHIVGANGTKVLYVFTTTLLGMTVLRAQLLSSLRDNLLNTQVVSIETLAPSVGPIGTEIVKIGTEKVPLIDNLICHFHRHPAIGWMIYNPGGAGHPTTHLPSKTHVLAASHGIIFRQVVNKRPRLKPQRSV